MGMLSQKSDDRLSGPAKHASPEWQQLPRDLPACLTAQQELMTMPVDWPGFHSMCIESLDSFSISVRSVALIALLEGRAAASQCTGTSE